MDMALSTTAATPCYASFCNPYSLLGASSDWCIPPLNRGTVQDKCVCLATSHVIGSKYTTKHHARAPLVCTAAASDSSVTTPAAAESRDSTRIDVSSSCVKPSFRSGPQAAQETEGRQNRVEVLFLSEGNVCRSVYAEAIFNSLVCQLGVQDELRCTSRATRDYNVGEAPDSRALEVAREVNLELREDIVAQLFVPSKDIVIYDLAVVMDKFNAADVLKEVSVYDTIDPSSRYSVKVRRLGDFCQTRQIEDIDDPLYGNMGGPDELENLREVHEEIRDSCQGLVDQLLELRKNRQECCSLRQAVGLWLQNMETMDWMVPPMLQKR